MKKLKVLIGCEESQAICKAFRDLGHEAYSNDIQECSGEHPEWHLHMDVFEAIKLKDWDLIILHPPCTYLAVSGNRWYGRGTAGYQKRLDSLEWTLKLWNEATSICNYVAMENPVGVLTSIKELPLPQYIQPYEYGHGEQKKTGFWLHGLPNLVPTNVVEGREQLIWKMGPTKDPKERGKLRSKTYEGVAKAIADQWSNFIINKQ